MRDGVGPAAYANRADTPDLTVDGAAKIVPLRAAPGFGVEHPDPDPRGKPAFGADGVVGGIVRDIWVDRSESIFRYLEVEVGPAGATRNVLLPVTFAKINGRGEVRVQAILGAQFAGVPAHASPELVTLREEDRISAYYGGGTLYAEPSRREPLF
jgi:photosynthetic reaction center H subunit